VLSGEHDLRAPTEVARELTRELTGTRLLVVRGAGHAVVFTDSTRCAQRAARRFLLDAPAPASCPGSAPAAVPAFPDQVGDLEAVRRTAGAAGRTLRAVERTLQDVVFAGRLAPERKTFGGLRGGVFSLGAAARLRAVEVVPDVEVTARPLPRERLGIVVSGTAAARGRLVMHRDGTVSGRLGGRRVRARLAVGLPFR
jgi:hypothetical protein